MTDIELVIKIPEEYYELVLKSCKEPILLNAFKGGTPLPKGHGRLIDADDLLDRIGLEDNDSNREDNVGEIITLEDFDFIPTIIEADKEYEVEIITRGNCMMCGKKLDEGLFFCKECESKAGSEE